MVPWGDCKQFQIVPFRVISVIIIIIIIMIINYNPKLCSLIAFLHFCTASWK